MVIASSLLADEGLVRSPTELKGERCCFLGGGWVGLKSGLLKPVGCVGPAGCDWRLDQIGNKIGPGAHTALAEMRKPSWHCPGPSLGSLSGFGGDTVWPGPRGVVKGRAGEGELVG